MIIRQASVLVRIVLFLFNTQLRFLEKGLASKQLIQWTYQKYWSSPRCSIAQESLRFYRASIATAEDHPREMMTKAITHYWIVTLNALFRMTSLSTADARTLHLHLQSLLTTNSDSFSIHIEHYFYFLRQIQ